MMDPFGKASNILYHQSCALQDAPTSLRDPRRTGVINQLGETTGDRICCSSRALEAHEAHSSQFKPLIKGGQ